MYSGFIYENDSYDITIVDHNDDKDDDDKDDDDNNIVTSDIFYYYTVEGVRMKFYKAEVYGEMAALFSQQFINSANGRVTIPSYANGYPVRNISHAVIIRC